MSQSLQYSNRSGVPNYLTTDNGVHLTEIASLANWVATNKGGKRKPNENTLSALRTALEDGLKQIDQAWLDNDIRVTHFFDGVEVQ